MCCRRRAARRAARHGCGRGFGPNRGCKTRNDTVVYQPRQGLIRQIVNHIIEHREQKQALARGEFVQPKALEDGKQEMGVERGVQQSGWVDEKQQLGMEDLGVGVDRVGTNRNIVDLPTYREALKN